MDNANTKYIPYSCFWELEQEMIPDSIIILVCDMVGE